MLNRRGWPKLAPEGDPPPGGEGKDPPPPPPPRTISADILPEDLRDRPDAEVKFLLGHMVTALGERNNQVDALKDQIASMRGSLPKPPPAAPDPDEDKPNEELILENVEKVLDRWAEKRGYVRAVGDLSDQVGEATFALVARELDDFEEHEETVRKLLNDSKIAPTKKNIIGAYTMAVGQKALAMRGQAGRAGTGSIPPGTPPPPAPPGNGAPSLSDLEMEVMRAHGVTDAAEWIKYRDTPMEVKLPK